MKFGIEQRGAIAGDLCPKNLNNHPFGVRNTLYVLTDRVWCTEPKANHREANTCFWSSGSGIPETGHLGSGKDIMPTASMLGAWALSQISSLSAYSPPARCMTLGSFLTSLCSVPRFLNLGNENSKVSLLWVNKAPNAAFM